MKKIEIWRYHSVFDEFTAETWEELSEWYKEDWIYAYDNGQCTFYLFDDEKDVDSFNDGLYELFYS